MDHEALQRLRSDHRFFEHFLKAIDKECACLDGGGHADMGRLKSIVDYLGKHSFPAHHALEDAIFAKLEWHLPRFRQDIFDLPEDHDTSHQEFRRFSAALESNAANLSDAGRSFTANERGHFISEEEVIFKYAHKYLTPGQWEDLRDLWSVKVAIPKAGFPLIADLLG